MPELSSTPREVTLRVRRKYFDRILSGDKKIEYRSETQKYAKSLPNAEIIKFICGPKSQMRVRVLSVQLIETPQKLLTNYSITWTARVFAIHLGEVLP